MGQIYILFILFRKTNTICNEKSPKAKNAELWKIQIESINL